ncbi:SLC13 family permease, partial [Qipengyuania sp.]|uniref:SLC13 family permease n=1 Tax=Qipengyuania sp. TaxID=2004515 RepID=UPI0035C7E782
MTAKRVGLVLGLLAFVLSCVLPTPAGLDRPAMVTGGLVLLMAAWWMTEALPLTATALVPFLVLPIAGVMDAKATASAYYSPILFLILGGAFLALAIERTGMHRRLALWLLRLSGARSGQRGVLFAFMTAAAVLSMLISNTSTALIMVPMALAVLEAGGSREGATQGLAGALPMGIAFAATIGGLGTLVGTPTNAIAVGLIDRLTGVRIGFAEWALYGLPLVLLGVPLAAAIIGRVQRVADHPFDIAAARAAISSEREWSTPEKRLLPVIA